MSGLALRLSLKLVKVLAGKAVKSTDNRLDDRIFAPIKAVMDTVDRALK